MSDPKGHEWQSPPGHEKVTKTRVKPISHWVSLITPRGKTLGWGMNFFQCCWIYWIVRKLSCKTLCTSKDSVMNVWKGAFEKPPTGLQDNLFYVSWCAASKELLNLKSHELKFLKELTFSPLWTFMWSVNWSIWKSCQIPGREMLSHKFLQGLFAVLAVPICLHS